MQGSDKGNHMDTFQLVVLEGPQAGLVLEAQGVSMRLGRTRASKLQIKDPSVSERHAEVVWKDSSWQIRDLGSSNGTALNGRAVEDIFVRLQDGDLLKLGTDSVAQVKISAISRDDLTVQQFLEAERGQLENMLRSQAEKLANDLRQTWLQEKQELLIV